jgi:hypothetical protein
MMSAACIATARHLLAFVTRKKRVRVAAARHVVWLALAATCATQAHAQEQRVEDIPTRPGVTQRVLVLSPPEPKAAVILFTGGHGGLQIGSGGSIAWGEKNFLVRSRRLFAEAGLLVAVVDAPSDRQAAPFLGGFRQRPEHAEDVKRVIARLRQMADVPVWLVGTSRGTQSAASVATRLTGPEGPNGVVLTSTIVSDDRGRPVPAMPLDRIQVPVLLVHHELDACRHCAFSEVPGLLQKLSSAPRSQLITFKGGVNRGDPCEPMAYHGYNGLEREVVRAISQWILAR